MYLFVGCPPHFSRGQRTERRRKPDRPLLRGLHCIIHYEVYYWLISFHLMPFVIMTAQAVSHFCPLTT